MFSLLLIIALSWKHVLSFFDEVFYQTESLEANRRSKHHHEVYSNLQNYLK